MNISTQKFRNLYTSFLTKLHRLSNISVRTSEQSAITNRTNLISSGKAILSCQIMGTIMLAYQASQSITRVPTKFTTCRLTDAKGKLSNHTYPLSVHTSAHISANLASIIISYSDPHL
uniref:Uncharacterized protein n=1 Tax=Opuntia streptacantha TaxID=393608 RepID=A0A7C9A2Q5_OPUST